MKEIALTHGLVALVDDDQFGRLSKYEWSAIKASQERENWYAVRSEGGKPVYMHRQIMEAEGEQQVDHRDRNGLNNQGHNLRFCDQSLNNANAEMPVGKSGYRGVTIDRRMKSRPWRADIWKDWRTGGRQFLGHFGTAEEAARAYDAAAIQQFGEFARPNFPDERAAA